MSKIFLEFEEPFWSPGHGNINFAWTKQVECVAQATNCLLNVHFFKFRNRKISLFPKSGTKMPTLCSR